MRWGSTAFATLLAALLVAGCTATPSGAGPGAKAGAGAPGGGTGDVGRGRQLFQSKGCIACHVAPGVPGATGTIGPNLSGIGDPSKRPTLADGQPNTPEHIREWIRDPQKLKPGTMMPNLNLSEREADDLVALLLTLR